MVEERRWRVGEARIRLVRARTGSCNRRIACCLVVEEVGSPQVAAPEISVRIAMDCVSAGLGNDIQDDVASLSVLSIVVVRKDLKLLDLFHRRAQRISRGDYLIGNIPALQVYREATRLDSTRPPDVKRQSPVVIPHACAAC